MGMRLCWNELSMRLKSRQTQMTNEQYNFFYLLITRPGQSVVGGLSRLITAFNSK